MLSVNNYPKEYIDDCRENMDLQLAAYERLVANADQDAIAAFEPPFFSNLVIALDAYFMHRSRTLEGKDGNPMNEVRLLCSSILSNRGLMAVDKTIKYKPAETVLKIRLGEAIKLSKDDFKRLSIAYFDAVEAQFGQ